MSTPSPPVTPPPSPPPDLTPPHTPPPAPVSPSASSPTPASAPAPAFSPASASASASAAPSTPSPATHSTTSSAALFTPICAGRSVPRAVDRRKSRAIKKRLRKLSELSGPEDIIDEGWACRADGRCDFFPYMDLSQVHVLLSTPDYRLFKLTQRQPDWRPDHVLYWGEAKGCGVTIWSEPTDKILALGLTNLSEPRAKGNEVSWQIGPLRRSSRLVLRPRLRSQNA
ncbi:hypothetical protein LLEC1_01182 [Akanthomyces lecanii]|uniref:Uncharacterized protein n=1 Tax=Cordyceps confragosa TaxID=2714763 RepID=A0A179IBZ9_CORDF|nr:hypothetical protein LLEC1_01182 [Akanthomyces lecanii]